MEGKFCPKCGSTAIVHEASYGGLLRCKNCGFRCAVFPEKVKEKKKKCQER